MPGQKGKILALALLCGTGWLAGCPSGTNTSGDAGSLEAACRNLCDLLPQCVLDSQIPSGCVTTCLGLEDPPTEAEAGCAADNLDCRCVRSIEDLAAFSVSRCEGGSFSTGLTGALLSARIMTYNIGNPDVDEANYPLRLSYQDYEDFIGAKIRELVPDVVVLQEVLSNDNICGAFAEGDPDRTCFDFANRLDPIRRILGDGYTLVCDQNLQTECIGVRTAFGGIEGVAAGAFVKEGAETLPLPLPACDWAAGECAGEECDRESTVSAVTVTTAQGNFRLVHLHPHAGRFDDISNFETGGECRSRQFRQAFEGYEGNGPLTADGTTLVLGDWNVDESFMGSDEEEILESYVGCDQRFPLLNPRDRDGGYAATYRPAAFAFDRVALDRGAGTCTIYGEEADGAFLADPLDQAFDFSGMPGGADSDGRIDHFAVVCDVTLEL